MFTLALSSSLIPPPCTVLVAEEPPASPQRPSVKLPKSVALPVEAIVI